jgi:Fe-S-cluster-containing hydrogenase component 2
VAAIQVPAFSENAYKALLAAIQKSSAPKKTLVVTCDEQSVRRRPWMDVEQVPGIAVMGICQLAMAAASSISETIVYCPDGLCAGKENAKKAAGLIASLVNEPTPVVSYVEGKDGAARVDQIHESARPRSLKLTQATSPWKDYVNCLASISVNELAATGFGFTEMHVADSCTLCNGCVESCPHHAIAIQQNTLNFQPEECTGCGYCAEICPEHSITLSQMKGPTTLQNRIVYTGEMVNCLKCGSPYASARMVEKVSTILHDDSATKLCPDCRQREIYEKIFARSQSAV